ncbi:2-oxo acid dehydrogenase subunit E2 [Natronolimnohabitans sp. A-GB9]|uniref:2-oxo acid dehydrogenase subunit E2 n=1 Tax=Natronolimnohabitans sp. A-GB9 TaxID=3069757 RepID=UPI0027AF3E10|nr:2-oxo acid dehydrogenase subunit E2 [Natronolimnohabitans sp. A-GB9]MDQ2052191.1 2-oxo acid dehydrogenase subunit E2 [Natronolimnohabitans sp. A-GB9]
MAYIIRMPKLGLEMERGVLLEWHVEKQESVEEGELVAEVESEKSVGEVEAREDGVLRRTYLEEGEAVPPGTPIGIVAPTDAEIDDLEAEAKADLEGEKAADAEKPTEAEPETGGGDAAGGGAETSTTSDDMRVSPRARKRAEELGVDLTTVEGTGYQGAITEEDVEATAEEAAGAVAAAGGRTLAEERPFDGMRQTIASRLSESYREAVHVTVHREADAEDLFAAVDAADDALEADVSVQDVLLLAVSATLEDHPAFNATFEDDTHRIWEEHNLGIAVDVEQGLIAPVLRDVESKSLSELSEERRTLVDDALGGEYTMDDLRGGTFTVTNLGVLGVESFDPVINPPQVAILGVDAVEERPVRGGGSEAGGEALEWRRHLPLDLSFDHRVVDGADAARFLGTLVDNLEEPWDLLPADIDRSGRERGESEEEMPGRTVTATNPDGMHGRIDAGSFEWQYDEPEDSGGTETGPTPVDVFLGGLASCLSLSTRYQAKKRDAEIGEISVTTDADPEHGSVESIEATIHLETDADDETVERIVELGERGCHVSQLLREDLELDLSWDRQ